MPNFTKNAIKASFLKLLNERPLNKITIKDIVTDCGINRNSFYYHFEDIPALIEEVVTEESDRIIKQYPAISSFEECLKISVEFVLKNKKAIYHIYNSVNRDIFEHYLWQACLYVVTTYINTVFSKYDIDATDKAIIIKYYKCELFGQVSEWLDNGLKEDILAVNHRLCEMRKGMIEELFERCQNSKN